MQLDKPPAIEWAVRSMVRAPKDYVLLSCDLSAAESWIVAYLANEPNMKRELKSKKIHEYSARNIFDLGADVTPTKEQRYVGKKMNHACSYRTSAYRACEFINEEGIITVTLAQTKKFHAKWHNAFYLLGWWGEIDEQIARLPRTMTNIYGYRRTFYGFYGDDLKKEATAFNPQSSVAMHMNGAIQPDFPHPGGLIEVRRQVVKPSKGSIRMIQTAHDSILMEVPFNCLQEVAEHVVSLLRRPVIVRGEELTIPVDAEYFPERWGEGEVKINV